MVIIQYNNNEISVHITSYLGRVAHEIFVHITSYLGRVAPDISECVVCALSSGWGHSPPRSTPSRHSAGLHRTSRYICSTYSTPLAPRDPQDQLYARTYICIVIEM